jgi:hypothetical protein
MLENIDDGILDQPPADAGYRAAQDSEKSCRTCVHYSGRYCDLWNAKSKPSMVCGVWDNFSDIEIAMAEGMDQEDSPEQDMARPMAEMDHESDSTDEISDRQEALYEVLEQVAYTFGKFDQSTGADGAHYVEKSPFEGMVCSNCVFFRGGRKCEIVTGDIAPEAICKFWIIPQNLLPAESEEDDADSAPDQEMND